MIAAVRCGRRDRRGLTFLEMTVSLTIFALLGYCLVIGVGVGKDSHRAVQRLAQEDRSMRSASSLLIDELRATSDATIEITALADGNHEVRFMSPIEDAGAPAWGVFDPLGVDDASRNLVGWSLRYTVRAVPRGDGTFERQLLRQVLDAAQAVQRERVVATGLRRGTDVPPGFTMVRQGDVWEVTLSTVGDSNTTTRLGAVIHVRTRN